jgi:serine phosphatase RsbU (regulator of sigma subunit)/anti-sigma regulatory factor (Ser/Thr protein kinase)
MVDRFRFHSLTLPSSRAAPGAASAWLREVGTRHGLTEERLFNLDLCLSELLANIGDHSYQGGEGEIGLELLLDGESATLTVIDNGPPFDPLAHQQPEAPASIDEAPVGGLGLHLVRQFADAVNYERVEAHNRVKVHIGHRPITVRREDRRQRASAAFPLTRSDGTRVEMEQRSESDRRLLGIIAKSALFRGVPPRGIDDILAQCELRTCAAREVLFRAGERHRCVLVAIEGTLEVHLDGPDSKFFVELGPGQCVGELSVSDGKPNSAWVVAGTPARLLVIPEPVFLGSVLGQPAIARNLIVALAERMRRNNVQILARLKASLELEALQRELDVARQIQSSMLPAAPLFAAVPDVEGLGFMRAARQVGGDFYDAFPLGDDRLFLAIGDVCGKGTPAALFMVRTLTILRSEALRLEPSADLHLARMAERCNDLLAQANDAQQFVTLFCAIVDLAAGTLHYVNAGHNAPLLRLPGVAPEFIEGPRNPLSGLVPGLKFETGSMAFPSGSLLLLYTDGVTEAESADGSLFGDGALWRLFADDAGIGAQTGVARVVAAVDAFAAGHAQSDDITLLALRRA